MDTRPTILEAEDNTESTYVIDQRIEIVDGQYGQWKPTQKNGKMSFHPYGSAVFVEKIYVRLETLERIFILSFKDAQGRKILFAVSRKDLVETEMRKFLEKGCQVTKKSMQTFITSIMNQEPDAPCEMVHRTLGFTKYNGETIFLGSEGIGIESNFDSDLKVQPHGKFSEWKKMVKTEVIGHIPMEFILAVACTAPLVDYFREDLHTGNILVSMVAESSTGKTTAGCFAVSIGAKASFDGDSMITTFADTSNSIMHSIQSSYPMLIDEGSLITGNQTSLLYSLAQGKEKGRLTKSLNKAEAITFASTILMTSERSILSSCDANTGLLVRCIEIINVTWTKSADSADHIKRTCDKHYGHMVHRIARYLLNADKEELILQYEDLYQGQVSRMKKKRKYNSLTERFSKSVALILLGARVASDILKVELDVENVRKFIEEHSLVYSNEDIDIGKRAMIFVCQYISKNYTLFIKGSRNNTYESPVPPNCKGYFFETKEKVLKNRKHVCREVHMSEINFHEMLLEGGFMDSKIILKRWKEEGLLHSEKDRYTSNVSIGETGTVKGYRFYIEPEYVNIIEKEQKN